MRIRTLIQWDEPHIEGQPLVRHEPGEVADIDESKVMDLQDLIDGGTVMKSAEMLTLAPPTETLTADEGTAIKGLRNWRKQTQEGDETT
jgi:hypothetical protein